MGATARQVKTHRFGFEPMVDIVPEGQVCQDEGRSVRIEHFTVEASPMRAVFHPRERVTPGRYARLMINGGVMMSDVMNEQNTNMEPVQQARGDVLIAGLGLGMILVPMLKNPNVTSITVVEKNPAVILLVAKHINAIQPGKLLVFQGDIHAWRPAAKGRQFDVIYFDIWGDQSTDEVPVMQQLHRTFRRYLRVGGWVSSWNYEDLRDRRRRGGW